MEEPMSTRHLTEGRWFAVQNAKQHANLAARGNLEGTGYSWGRVQKGKYAGHGQYILLSYEQRCPRNCCDDHVFEVLSAAEVVEECREQMVDLANMLSIAKRSVWNAKEKIKLSIAPEVAKQ
jgi:hypothetical protein